jgi:hypothetical protein
VRNITIEPVEKMRNCGKPAQRQSGTFISAVEFALKQFTPCCAAQRSVFLDDILKEEKEKKSL